ncbi:hypothetical protein ACP3UV_17305 [Mixta calida]
MSLKNHTSEPKNILLKESVSNKTTDELKSALVNFVNDAINSHEKSTKDVTEERIKQIIAEYDDKKSKDAQLSKGQTIVWGTIMAALTVAISIWAMLTPDKEKSFFIIGMNYFVMMAILEFSNYPSGKEKNYGSAALRIIFGLLALAKFSS